MRYLSLCSGIEAASVAWLPLGWTPSAFSEIDPFACAVLAHRFPDVPNLGDMLEITDARLAALGPVDVVVGGTPCQPFSLAGRRGGMDDARGRLALKFADLVAAARPRWVVWENVPGVLSSGGGRDFGAFLGSLADIGYGFAYRVLDACGFGVPQRRRRVFVVGCARGSWQRAAGVLVERQSMCGHPPPRREAGATPAALTANGVGTCGADDNQAQAGHLIPAVAHTLRGEGFDASEDGPGRGTPIIPAVAYQCHGSNVGPMGTLRTSHNETRGVPFLPAVAFHATQDPISSTERSPSLSGNAYVGVYTRAVDLQNAQIRDPGIAGTIQAEGSARGNRGEALIGQGGVRRLTPRECERLQGFPDDWTLVPYGRTRAGRPAKLAKMGPRYKAIGNSIATPVLQWIGRRIAAVDAIEQKV